MIKNFFSMNTDFPQINKFLQTKYIFPSNKTLSVHSSDTDIIIGGLYPVYNNSKRFIVSTPYMQDELTWCVRKADKMSWLSTFMTGTSASVWITLVFGYGYGSGFVLYLMLQFDKGYRQRNNRDWHYTTILIALPTFIGISQRFHPKAWTARIFYGCMLLGMFAFTQIGTTYLFKFFQVRFPKHQIATIDELASNDYTLMGSSRVRNLIRLNEQVSINSNGTFFAEF